HRPGRGGGRGGGADQAPIRDAIRACRALGSGRPGRVDRGAAGRLSRRRGRWLLSLARKPATAGTSRTNRGAARMRRPIFTAEHDDLRESFGRYLDKEVVHAYDGWEKEGRIPRAALRRAGELGFLGFGVPEAFGGPGAEDFRFNAVINEEA